jgi:N-methylhydantoinase B
VPLQLDPVTLEVMSRKLAAITDEMYFSVQRAARSSYVKEAADFATALLDPQGDVFAYPPSATFAFLIDTDFKATLDAVPHMEPGDVIITNDPYASGGVSTHLSDLHLFQPYFAGDRVIAWGWSFVHCADIGGAVPGSVSPALTSIFMEGFRIPPLKLMKRGEPNEDLFALLHLNSRMGELNLGDLRAMLGALETGNRRMAELVGKQGAETLLAAERGLQDYTARKARDVLRKIPDGVYEFWDFLDDDMVTGIPIRVRLRMTVNDGLVDLDMSGSDPQVRSAYNVPTMGRRTYWLTFRLTTVLTTFDPLMPHNAGLYRGITVNVPRGSVLRAEFPDAVSVRNSVPYRLFDCISGAIMQAAPKLMPAATGGTLVTFSLSEIGPDGASRVVEAIEPLRCGMGAVNGRDGVDARDNSLNNMRNHPLELVEATSSIRILEYDVRPDSGGPGKWRGGVGQTITAEMLCDGGIILARGLDRMRFPAWGVQGGMPGGKLEVILNRGRADEQRLGKIHELHVKRGDTITLGLPGGGGYGDPMERDVADVLADVRGGFVMREAAERDYGVVIADDAVDAAATKAARARTNAQCATFGFGPDRERWEAVFTDAVMTELNARLYALPKAVRQDVRRDVFEAAVPGITGSAGHAITELLTDPSAAARRLRAALDAMGQGVGGGSASTPPPLPPTRLPQKEGEAAS